MYIPRGRLIEDPNEFAQIIRVCADAEGSVAESDEADNCMEIKWYPGT